MNLGGLGVEVGVVPLFEPEGGEVETHAPTRHIPTRTRHSNQGLAGWEC